MEGTQQDGGGWLSAWERGQDLELAITVGGPTWLLAEGKCVEGWEGSRGAPVVATHRWCRRL